MGMAYEQAGIKIADNLRPFIDYYMAHAKPTDRTRDLVEAGYVPGSPEYKEAYRRGLTDNRTSEQKNYEAARQQGFGGTLMEFKEASRADPAIKQRVAMLEHSGVPTPIAQGLAAGRYEVNRHPISGTAQVVDKATGRIVFDGAAQNGQGPQPGAGSGPEASPQGPGAGASGGTSMPRDVAYPEGTGTGSMVRGGLNTLMEVFGGKAPYPEVERATQALTNLQVRTQTALQSAIPGRPSNYLMERLDRLAVKPGSPFTGDERAYERFRQTRDMLREEIARMDRDILGRAGDFTPAQIAETRANRSQIEGVLRDYDVVVGSYEEARQPQRRVPSGAVQELKANPSPERRKQFDAVFGEGAAARAIGSR
jgi:hypothetical protein